MSMLVLGRCNLPVYATVEGQFSNPLLQISVMSTLQSPRYDLHGWLGAKNKLSILSIYATDSVWHVYTLVAVH